MPIARGEAAMHIEKKGNGSSNGRFRRIARNLVVIAFIGLALVVNVADLSPSSHPAMSGVLASFEP
jgi:hypothetical protein